MPIQQIIQQKLQPWWQGRSTRERRILAAWVAAVAVLALWFGAFAPLFQRIATLERRVPELETQLNRMRAQPPADAHLSQRHGHEPVQANHRI